MTVKFEINDPVFSTIPNVTCPVLGSEYIRLPLQTSPGTKGFVIAIDAYLGGMSGLGGGVADLTQQANLATLVFVPVGNTGFKPITNPNALTMYGGNGVTIQDTVQAASTVVVTPSSITSTAANGGSSITMTQTSIVLTAGGHKITIDGGGIHLDQILWITHDHSGVQTGTGVTGPVSG